MNEPTPTGYLLDGKTYLSSRYVQALGGPEEMGRRFATVTPLYQTPQAAPSIAPTYRPGVARVTLFKPNGRYYTEEEWVIPTGALGPHDMKRSKDFRRIDGGPALVQLQEPWGYPHLFPAVVKP